MAIIGVLAPEPTYGLGPSNEAGQVVGVIWPFGYSARRDAEGTVLFDRLGRALAREGDRVRMAGWVDSRDGVAHPCAPPGLEVIAAGRAASPLSAARLTDGSYRPLNPATPAR